MLEEKPYCTVGLLKHARCEGFDLFLKKYVVKEVRFNFIFRFCFCLWDI